jgi:uncharacterized protein with FMN-binding domain
MKRALLIAGGTVGGLGAVLAITPPQLTSSSSSLSLGGGTNLAGGTNGATATPAAATTTAPATKATPAATKSTATKPATTKPAASQSASASPTATKSASPTPSATKTTAAPATSNVSGTFTGDPINVGYGIVQVKITVSNGKITDAQAVQAPSGRNDRFTQMSVPVLRQKTLAAQSSQISGVSGASYTSYGWYKSLQSALTKAGLPL